MRGETSSGSQEQVQLPQLNPSTLKMTWMTENLHGQMKKQTEMFWTCPEERQ